MFESCALHSSGTTGPLPFPSSLLRTSAEGLAGLAASRLLEGGPSEGFEDWKGHLRQQVLELASAAEAGAPDEFASHLAWKRDAFAAREIPADLLLAALECLQAVVEESLPEAGRSGLQAYFDAARSALAGESASTWSALSREDSKGALALDFLERIFDGDGDAGKDLVKAALDDGDMDVHEVLEEVIVPAMREVGSRWHQGHISIADEHLASEAIRSLISLLLANAKRPPPLGRTVLLTSVEGNAHDLGILVVAAFFELDGWRTLCLGADTPTQDLVVAALRFDVDLVTLGATMTTQRPAVARAIAALREVRPAQPVLVGGGAFLPGSDRYRLVGADAQADTGRDAVKRGRELVGL